MKISELASKAQAGMDRFWAKLFLTPGGKPKSALLLYSFCLSLLLFAVYCLSYYYLIDWIEYAIASSAPVIVTTLVQSIVPGLLGTLVCCLAWFIPVGDKRLLPYAYQWLCAYALFALIAMLALLDWEEYRIFLYFFLTLVPVGLISGVFASQLLYRSRMRGNTAAGESNAVN